MQTNNDILIHTFRPDDQHAFAALNRAWLTAYGLLEAPDERQLELVKLAVAPEAQGFGLGWKLVEACVAYARGRGARRLVLLSNSRLWSALCLYEGLGFRRGPRLDPRMQRQAEGA